MSENSKRNRKVLEGKNFDLRCIPNIPSLGEFGLVWQVWANRLRVECNAGFDLAFMKRRGLARMVMLMKAKDRRGRGGVEE